MAKLKGATLVEAIIAMVIVSICSAAFFSCFQLVISSTKSIRMGKIMEQVEDIKYKTQEEKDFEDDEVELGDVKILKTVKDTDHEKLKLLHIEVKEGEVLLEDFNYFVVKND